MYKDIIETIKTRLEEIPQIKQVFAYPLGDDENITQYPAVIFLPDNSDSTFSDTSSNHRILNFKLWVNVAGTQINKEKLYTQTLPVAVDAVMAKLDQGWDFGTINGHRVWCRLSSGQWSITLEEKSIVASAELNLVVRFDKQI